MMDATHFPESNPQIYQTTLQDLHSSSLPTTAVHCKSKVNCGVVMKDIPVHGYSLRGFMSNAHPTPPETFNASKNQMLDATYRKLSNQGDTTNWKDEAKI